MPLLNDRASSMSGTIRAIIPAAGRSRRMGSPKQLLPVDGRPMLESVLAPLLQPCLAGILLVTHTGLADPLTAIIAGVPPGSPSIHLAFNDDPASGMVDSIRIALRAWPAHAALAPSDGFLIVPSDQPGIPASAVAACCAAFAADPTRIVIATHAGRRGHPLVFPAALVPFVESPACDHGLNALVHAHPASILAVEHPSPAIVRNINTPEDYTALNP